MAKSVQADHEVLGWTRAGNDVASRVDQGRTTPDNAPIPKCLLSATGGKGTGAILQTQPTAIGRERAPLGGPLWRLFERCSSLPKHNCYSVNCNTATVGIKLRSGISQDVEHAHSSYFSWLKRRSGISQDIEHAHSSYFFG